MSSTPNLNFQNLKLGIAPREGLKALGLTLPVTPAGFSLDLTLEQIKSQISQLEMLYVDNADNAFPVSAYMGGTGQRIICPPNSQAYFFLLLPNPPKLIFTAQSNISLNIQLLNFRMNPLIWNVLQGTMINPNQIALPDKDILVGNALGVAAAVSMSGDAKIADTGAITVLSASDSSGFNVPNGPIIPNKTSGIKGANTNSNAPAGAIGEYVSATILSGAAIPLTPGTPTTIVSVLLQPGDWDVSATFGNVSNASTQFQGVLACISLVNNTLDLTPGNLTDQNFNNVVPSFGPTLNVGPVRYLFAVATRVYLVADASFTVSTNSGFGIIQARRSANAGI